MSSSPGKTCRSGSASQEKGERGRIKAHRHRGHLGWWQRCRFRSRRRCRIDAGLSGLIKGQQMTGDCRLGRLGV